MRGSCVGRFTPSIRASRDIRVIRLNPAQAGVIDDNAMYVNPRHRPQRTAVGAGLLANASVESIPARLTQRFCQQAGSYRFPANAWDLALGVSPPGMKASRDVRVIRFDPVQARAMKVNPMYVNPRHRPRHTSVGAGLLANASVESISARLTQRLRQQAGSYRFQADAWILRWAFHPEH
jgi:hypothetical protein